MRKVTVVVIGAGQAGLSMSRELSHRNIDHLVLERGEIAHSWRRERWDSLRLISPNWMNGLPGHPYRGRDQHGFMPVSDLIARFDRFAASERLPIQTQSPVCAVRPGMRGYRVETLDRSIACNTVVVASGAFAQAKRPPFAEALPRDVAELTPLTYKRPSDLAQGRVLVVGASASGVQLAREIHQSGRPVTLAVGSHLRVPRRYRSADIDVWMHLLGLLDVTGAEVDDLARVRRTPSMQLSGRNGGETLDLNALQDLGIEIAGRLASIADGRAYFSGSLANVCASADLKMNRLLRTIDEWVDEHELAGLIDPPEVFAPTRVPKTPRLSLDFGAENVRSVVWASGLRPDHGFLDLPVFDRKGQIRHQGGVVAPGLIVMGLPFLRRRKSHLIDGAGDDARDLAGIVQARLDHRCAA